VVITIRFGGTVYAASYQTDSPMPNNMENDLASEDYDDYLSADEYEENAVRNEEIHSPFWEGKIELYNLLSTLIIPIVSIGVVLTTKSKKLWLTPLLSFAIFIVTTFIFYPAHILNWFPNREPETIDFYWLFMMLPLHVTISVILTIITYIVKKCINFFSKRR
jgi:hypothetical protein